MDPITALSVAGSIFQLVDFGIKVVSKGNKIYHSGDGTTAENHDLEKVANDLVLIQTRLTQSLNPLGAHGTLPEHEQALLDLGATSTHVAEELLEQLNKAKAQGRFRRWKSLRQAVKAVTSKGDVAGLAKRLLMLRDQLNLRILVDLKNNMDIASVEQGLNYERLHRTSKDILHAMKDNHNFLSRGLESNANAAAERHRHSDALVVQTGKNIIASVTKLAQKWEETRKNYVRQPSQMLPSLTIEKAVLRSLLYPMINDRSKTIPEAHAKTFQWIFQDPKLHKKPWNDFTSWLRYSNAIYWVNGKAASGKSTLMKFLSTQPEVQRHLAVWAENMPFVCAHFFFWNLGSPLQKSQCGLLRSLLHQALSQHAHVIPQVMPKLREEMSQRSPDFLRDLPDSWHSWSVYELRQVLEDVFKRTTESIKFCFFIDGLDEYDGDHLEILSLLRNISLTPNVKLCISSRPLLVFEQEFEGCPTLCLQDLTVDDIKLYVHDKLNEHKAMSKLHLEEPDLATSLIAEIVKMSSGVFLWVTIAIRSLLKSLTNHDSISDLQRRLRQLPPELDDLFSLMLRSIKPDFYFEQASRLFQLVYHADRPPSTVQLSIADDEDVTIALKDSPYTLSPEQCFQRDASMSARLKSRCAGLLEVHRDHENENQASKYINTVNYLHLTVKEFLEKPEVWKTILQCTSGTTFDAHVAWLRVSVVKFKACHLEKNLVLCLPGTGHNITEDISNAMEYAAHAEDSTGQAQVALLDELEKAVQCFRAGSPSAYEHSPMLASGCDMIDCFHRQNVFLTSAVSHGLSLYLKVKLGGRARAMDHRACVPLLKAAMIGQWGIESSKPRLSKLRLPMLRFLLEEGLDPNDSSRGTSPWRRILEYLGDYASGLKDIAWFDACRLFLSYGASPQETLRSFGSPGPTSALDIISKAISYQPLSYVQELEAMLFHFRAVAKVDKQIGRKRKAHNGEKDPPPARKRTSRSTAHVGPAGSRNSVPEHPVWSTKSVLSQEKLVDSFTEWSDLQDRGNGQISDHWTFGTYQRQSHPRRRSGIGHEAFWNYSEFPERWHETDQYYPYLQRQREQTSSRYVSTSDFEGCGNFHSPPSHRYRNSFAN